MKYLTLFTAILILITSAYAAPQPVGFFPDAQSITIPENTLIVYNTDPGYKMGFTTISVPWDSRSDFTLRYGAGSTVSGYAEYRPLNLVQSRVIVSIGGNTSTRDFIDARYDVGGGGVTKQLRVTGYAQDEADGTKGFAVWDPGLGIWSNQIAYISVSGENNLISGITVTSTRPTEITVAIGTDLEISENANKNPIDIIYGWVQFAGGIATTVYDLATISFHWLKFFFWDHLLITIALYIALTGAMAFSSIKDVFKALKRFFGYQMSLFNGIIGMWQKLIDLIDRFSNIFKP